MSSGSANLGYKRLTTTVDLTGRDAAELAFKISYDTEPAYDFVFVEARSVGAARTGRRCRMPTATSGTSVGVGCTESSDYWLSAHPHLREYIVRSSTRTTTWRLDVRLPGEGAGQLERRDGQSMGWQDWRVAVNNADFTGDQIEVSIVYQTDPGTLGLGAFVDDAKVTRAPTRRPTRPSRTASARGASRARCRAAPAT